MPGLGDKVRKESFSRLFQIQHNPRIICRSLQNGITTYWALFALSHHYLVWLATELTLPQNRPFTRYAVLGDDIVIADPKVAGKYKEMLGK